jgi:hypothetical protein
MDYNRTHLAPLANVQHAHRIHQGRVKILLPSSGSPYASAEENVRAKDDVHAEHMKASDHAWLDSLWQNKKVQRKRQN